MLYVTMLSSEGLIKYKCIFPDTPIRLFSFIPAANPNKVFGFNLSASTHLWACALDGQV